MIQPLTSTANNSKTKDIPDSHNPQAIAAQWLCDFSDALADNNIDETLALFEQDAYWRDLVSFSWNIKTVKGHGEIRDLLTHTLAATAAKNWCYKDWNSAPADAQKENAPNHHKHNQVEFWFDFETKYGKGHGHARLRNGRCWTLLTTLQSLKGHEEKTANNHNRENGTEFVPRRNRKSWLEKRQTEIASIGRSEQPYCLIVGGGQAGIGLAARLKRLNVPTLVIERNPKAGDSWRNRYRSLCLHDPVWYDHMPYLPFPDHWPVYCPKDQLGDWLEMYTKIMQVNYWSSTECQKADYDETEKKWHVQVDKNGESITLNPTHLILATGMSGFANMPEFAGASSFKGEICHSSGYGRKSANDPSSQSTSPEAYREAYRGKHAIVVGSNNSAHDIAVDLWENEAHVTLLQRSSSLVVKAETLAKGAVRKLFSDEAVKAGITTEIADMTLASTPYEEICRTQIKEYRRIAEQDADFYQALTNAGFQLDFAEDGSGLYSKYLRYGAGYYIDVGGSQLIIDGQIDVKSNVTIAEVKTKSVILSDGTELPADIIVCATGYTSMNDWAAKLISQDVADKVGKCWGLGSGTYRDPGPWVGELRNMWKPTQQPHLWFHGGNLQQGRHYSLYLALQLKARMEGIPTEVYGMDPVHHLR